MPRGTCGAPAGARTALWLFGQPLPHHALLAKCAGCPMTPDMPRNSRMTRSNALVRSLAWNLPFQAKHDAYPPRPLHVPPDAHVPLEPRITFQAPS